MVELHSSKTERVLVLRGDGSNCPRAVFRKDVTLKDDFYGRVRTSNPVLKRLFGGKL
jgi:hypothetical protein